MHTTFKFQALVLAELHIDHPGMVRMKSLARLHVWWSTLDQDIEQTVRDCPNCKFNRCKSPLKVSNPWIWPTRPRLAGPMDGVMYLIVVDAKSKWMEVLPMSSTTTATTLRVLRFLFSLHGLPEEIVSDNGPQFVSQEMKDFLKSNGIRQCLSSPCHPASNGEAERAVRTFKDAMKVRKNEQGSTAEKLARFLLGYRTTPHTATGCIPAEILMGRRLRTRLDLLHPDLSARMERKTSNLKHSTPRVLGTGDPVLVKDYRARKDPWVKGVIQTKLTPVTYRVQVGELLWKRHVDQLRDLSGSTIADSVSRNSDMNKTKFDPLVSTPTVTKPDDLLPENVPVPDKSAESLIGSEPSSSTIPPVAPLTSETTTDVSENLPNTRRYPSRVRTTPKRLIHEI